MKCIKRAVTELKQLIIHRINSIDDEKYLNAIKILTDSKDEPVPYKLDDFEKQKISKARQQIKEGKTVSHEKVVDNAQRWLKE